MIKFMSARLQSAGNIYVSKILYEWPANCTLPIIYLKLHGSAKLILVSIVNFSFLWTASAHVCHLTDKVIGVLAEGMKYADLKKLK